VLNFRHLSLSPCHSLTRTHTVLHIYVRIFILSVVRYHMMHHAYFSMAVFGFKQGRDCSDLTSEAGEGILRTVLNEMYRMKTV
jgi:hypothetical protein